jgi:hypothetical protein
MPKKKRMTVTTPESRVQPPAVFRSPSRHRSSGRSRPRLAAGLLVLLFVFLLAPVIAPRVSSAAAEQKPYALIFGTVFSADGRLMYGVPVMVRRADKKKTLQESMSDHQGEFAFRVPPGPADYLVWADIKPPKKKASGDAAPPASAAQAQTGMELKVHVDADERVDISLHLPESVKPY